MENNKEKNFVSAVVYMRNDMSVAFDFIRGIDKTLEKYFLKYEIIVVNDSSKDKSVDEVKKYASSSTSTISILNMSFYQGVEMCMNAGLDLSIGDFVFEFDSMYCDWDWDLLFSVYQTSLEGNDIVFALNGNRKKHHQAFYWLFNKYAHVQHHIADTSFCLITRRGINRVRSLTKTVPYRKALYANCGLVQKTVEFANNIEKGKPRKEKSPYNSLILFTDIAYKFSATMTAVMVLVILFVIVYAIAIFLIGKPVEGWTTTMLFVGISFLGIFSIMSVILKYLSLITNLIFRKQNYVFESIEKLTNQ